MALFSPHVQAQAFKVVPQDLDPSKADATFDPVDKILYECDFKELKDQSGPYPQLTHYGKRWVRPLGTLQGIDVSFAMFQNSSAQASGSTQQRFDIWIFVENKTGKTIYYERDKPVAIVKFPGEQFSWLGGDGEYHLNTGNKCFFYHDMLDEENGKYALKPGKTYVSKWYMYRDGGGLIASALLRKFRPHWFATLLPPGQTANSTKDKVIHTLDPAGSLASATNEDFFGQNMKKVELSADYPLLTPHNKKLIPKNGSFKKDVDWTILGNLGGLEVSIKTLSAELVDEGYIKYNITGRVKNVTSHNVSFTGGTQWFMEFEFPNAKTLAMSGDDSPEFKANRVKEGTVKTGGVIYIHRLTPGEVIEETKSVRVFTVSGEVFVKNGNYTFNKLIRTDLIPYQIEFQTDYESRNPEPIGYTGSDPNSAIVHAILLKGGLGKVTVGYNEFKSEKLPYGQGYKMVVKNPSATTKVRIGPLHPAFDRPSTTESKLEAGKEYFYIYGASSRSSPLAVTKEEANFFMNMNSWMKSNQYTEVTF